MKRYYGVVTGRVQGVGFRSFCQMKAYHFGLTGSIKNLSNGNVEFFVQGEETKLSLFLNEILQGDGRFIRVDDYSLKETSLVPNETGFRYHY